MLKAHAKLWMADMMLAGGGTRLFRYLRRRTLVILSYHRVLPTAQRDLLPIPDLAVTPETFLRHVAHVSSHYECLTLRDALQCLRRNPSTDKPLAVFTFDDGYWDNHAYARPILNAHGVPATFFVVSSLVGSSMPPWYDRMGRSLLHIERQIAARGGRSRPIRAIAGQIENTKMLDPRDRRAMVDGLEEVARVHGYIPGDEDRIMHLHELAELVNEGHEIGSHTRSHPILPQCTRRELVDELEGSRSDLRPIAGREVSSFAYPNGDYDEQVLAAARAAGYQAAVTMQPGLNSPDQDALLLRRLFVCQKRLSRPDGACSTSLLDLELTGAADTLLLRSHRLHHA